MDLRLVLAAVGVLSAPAVASPWNTWTSVLNISHVEEHTDTLWGLGMAVAGNGGQIAVSAGFDDSDYLLYRNAAGAITLVDADYVSPSLAGNGVITYYGWYDQHLKQSAGGGSPIVLDPESDGELFAVNASGQVAYNSSDDQSLVIRHTPGSELYWQTAYTLSTQASPAIKPGGGAYILDGQTLRSILPGGDPGSSTDLSGHSFVQLMGATDNSVLFTSDQGVFLATDGQEPTKLADAAIEAWSYWGAMTSSGRIAVMRMAGEPVDGSSVLDVHYRNDAFETTLSTAALQAALPGFELTNDVPWISDGTDWVVLNGYLDGSFALVAWNPLAGGETPELSVILQEGQELIIDGQPVTIDSILVEGLYFGTYFDGLSDDGYLALSVLREDTDSWEVIMAQVPEPTGLATLAGLAGLACLRRRRRA